MKIPLIHRISRALVLTASSWLCAECCAEDKRVVTRTFTYKTVGSLPIKLDVHRADDKVRRPLAVWIHGGALIVGHREAMDGRVKKRLLDAGYAVASIDYRLAPETKLAEIVGDVEDAFTWLRANGTDRFDADTDRIAVIGASAGGYLTLATGFRVQPPPTVLVSFYGYGDLIGAWYSRPSSHSRHHRIRLTEAEARTQVNGPPIADARNRNGNGAAFYQYCRQHGIWPREVSGWDPHTEAQEFHPYMPLKNVSADYPPTLLIHGMADTDVPYEQSVLMANRFRQHGVRFELISLPGGEHGLAGGNRGQIDASYELVLKFMNHHMRR